MCINEEVIKKGFARKIDPNERRSVPTTSRGPDYSPTRASISTANLSVDTGRNCRQSPARTRNSPANSPIRSSSAQNIPRVREMTHAMSEVSSGRAQPRVNTFSL